MSQLSELSRRFAHAEHHPRECRRVSGEPAKAALSAGGVLVVAHAEHGFYVQILVGQSSFGGWPSQAAASPLTSGELPLQSITFFSGGATDGSLFADGPLSPIVRPAWNAALRRLSFAGVLVKAFRQPAVNQEAILAAFEKDGWPDRIADPLPDDDDVDRCERLHNALERLNRQQQALLWFSRDGHGTGVCWRVRSSG